MKTRVEPVWLDEAVALAIHDRQVAEHGGGAGVRDPGALAYALARPVNRWHYGDGRLKAPATEGRWNGPGGEDDPSTLAASYAFGVARNHPFVDGNKRTAWVLARLFLALNGVRIEFDAEDAVRTVLALAAGELEEAELAGWFRERVRKRREDGNSRLTFASESARLPAIR